MISHLQNLHQEEYSQMLQKTSQRVKAEAKGMLAEEVEDALEHVEIKPEVKMEEDFEDAKSEGNNDEDYMGGISYDSEDSDNHPLISKKKRGAKRKRKAEADFDSEKQ